MGEKLLINVAVEETRVALVESGRLNNLEIETRHHNLIKGNVYKGVVHRVNASLQAAFVDYGAEKQGFLPVSEIHQRYYPKSFKGQKAPIQDLLKPRQELMVQVVKDEIGNKGASLTTYVSLPGRYLVLMPESEKTGISRRLPNDERQRLKQIISNLEVPEGFGLIIRTAGVERDELELANDLGCLKALFSSLDERFEQRRSPGLLHRERSLALRFIRDYATSQLEEIIIDDRSLYEEVRDFCTILMPEMRTQLREYTDKTPLYSRYQVEDQVDDVFARRIDLPSGGYIIIDQAEALVAVDVNSGRVKTNDIEATALKTNLEAASEIARQLKLRDRGGLVVVDFIDMRSKTNTREVEQAARDAFANDKAKVKFTRISDFGLMEISRQRLKSTITAGSFNTCHQCSGTGQTRSVQSSAVYLLRRLKETVLRASYLHATAKVPVPIANYLLNNKRRELLELEADSETTILIRGEPGCPPNTAFVELLSSSQSARRAKRVLLTFDFVRSDVEKEEMNDVDEMIIDAAAARGVDLTEDEFGRIYRDIEERMAKDAEILRAQLESEEAARPKPKPAPAAPAEPAGPQGPSLLARWIAWFKALLSPPAIPEARSSDRRQKRQPASERLRDRNRTGGRRGGRRSMGTEENRPKKRGSSGGGNSRGGSQEEGGSGGKRRRRRRRGKGGGGDGGGQERRAADSQNQRRHDGDEAKATDGGEERSSSSRRRRRRRRRGSDEGAVRLNMEGGGGEGGGGSDAGASSGARSEATSSPPRQTEKPSNGDGASAGKPAPRSSAPPSEGASNGGPPAPAPATKAAVTPPAAPPAAPSAPAASEE